MIKEAMRLYPPAYAVGREAFEEVEIGGFRIPKVVRHCVPMGYPTR